MPHCKPESCLAFPTRKEHALFKRCFSPPYKFANSIKLRESQKNCQSDYFACSNILSSAAESRCRGIIEKWMSRSPPSTLQKTTGLGVFCRALSLTRHLADLAICQRRPAPSS